MHIQLGIQYSYFFPRRHLLLKHLFSHMKVMESITYDTFYPWQLCRDGTSIVLSDEVGQIYFLNTGQGESQKDAKYDQVW